MPGEHFTNQAPARVFTTYKSFGTLLPFFRSEIEHFVVDGWRKII
jgi:hypothetical protein